MFGEFFVLFICCAGLLLSPLWPLALVGVVVGFVGMTWHNLKAWLS